MVELAREVASANYTDEATLTRLCSAFEAHGYIVIDPIVA